MSITSSHRTVVLAAILLSVFTTLCQGTSYKPTNLLRQDITSQVQCLEYESEPTDNCAWAAGLNFYADVLIEGGQIIAYKIQWRSGRWSDWFVPGINDIDKGYNSESRKCDMLPYVKNSLRRMWSFFTDHSHIFIICRPKEM